MRAVKVWIATLSAVFMAAHHYEMGQHLHIMDCYGILCLSVKL